MCNDFEPCVVDVDFVQRRDLSDESEEEYVYSTSKKYPSLPITNVGKMKFVPHPGIGPSWTLH